MTLLSGLLGDIFARFSGSYDANFLFIYTQYVNEFASSISAIRKVGLDYVWPSSSFPLAFLLDYCSITITITRP